MLLLRPNAAALRAVLSGAAPALHSAWSRAAVLDAGRGRGAGRPPQRAGRAAGRAARGLTRRGSGERALLVPSRPPQCPGPSQGCSPSPGTEGSKSHFHLQ